MEDNMAFLILMIVFIISVSVCVIIYWFSPIAMIDATTTMMDNIMDKGIDITVNFNIPSEITEAIVPVLVGGVG